MPDAGAVPLGRVKSTTRSLRTTFDGACNDKLSKYSPFQSVIVADVAVGGTGVRVDVGLAGTGVDVALAGGIGVGGCVGVELGMAVGVASGSGLAVMPGVITDVGVGTIGVSDCVGSGVAVIAGVGVTADVAGTMTLKRRYTNTHKSTVRTPTENHRILNRFTLQGLLSARAWSES